MKDIILYGGDRLLCNEEAAVVKFKGPRRVLSTSFLNGGMRDDLEAVFNFSEVYGKPDEYCEMRAPTNEGHLRIIAEELGLNPDCAAGLSTAAKMKWLQVREGGFDDFKLTALVTAGIDVSGNRIGDPAGWHEKKGIPAPAFSGTINILLFTDVLLAPGAMARAMTVCTEAKTAALQELLAPSYFSKGLATGSGTDGIVITSMLDSDICLTNSGTHCKLGENIGSLVKETVKAALVAENGFFHYTRGSLLRRLTRFGIDEKLLWEKYCDRSPRLNTDYAAFCLGLAELDRDELFILRVVQYGHLIDLLRWQLVDAEIAAAEAEAILNRLGYTGFDTASVPEIINEDVENRAEFLIGKLAEGITHVMVNNLENGN